MTTYLTIITTVLVITQIIRVLQNTISLRELKEAHRQNDEVMEVWDKIHTIADKYLRGE